MVGAVSEGGGERADAAVPSTWGVDGVRGEAGKGSEQSGLSEQAEMLTASLCSGDV